MSEIYNRIDHLCKHDGINVTEMCKLTGASRGALTDLKKGRTSSLSAKTLQKIADYFTVSVDYIVNGSRLGDSDGKRNAKQVMLGSELQKMIERIAEKIGYPYDTLVDIYLNNEIPRALNERNLMHMFCTYLELDTFCELQFKDAELCKMLCALSDDRRQQVKDYVRFLMTTG